MNKSPYLKLLRGVAEVLLIILVSFIAYSNIAILSFGQSHIVHSVKNVPPGQTLALVFGAGMEPDGITMRPMERDRVIRGIELYRAGKVEKIMMTGDNGERKVNEVGAMREYALAAGVPAEDVLVDPHGYRTYESCWRAAYVYTYSEVVAISQSFHLPRIRFFCEHMGIDTVGLSADLTDYGSVWTPYIREPLARVKGWWHLRVTKPLPREPGKI